MAEWSKACDSSESLPDDSGFSSAYAGRGSNPLLVIFFSHYPFVVTLPDYIRSMYSTTSATAHFTMGLTPRAPRWSLAALEDYDGLGMD